MSLVLVIVYVFVSASNTASLFVYLSVRSSSFVPVIFISVTLNEASSTFTNFFVSFDDSFDVRVIVSVLSAVSFSSSFRYVTLNSTDLTSVGHVVEPFAFTHDLATLVLTVSCV